MKVLLSVCTLIFSLYSYGNGYCEHLFIEKNLNWARFDPANHTIPDFSEYRIIDNPNFVSNSESMLIHLSKRMAQSGFEGVVKYINTEIQRGNLGAAERKYPFYSELNFSSVSGNITILQDSPSFTVVFKGEQLGQNEKRGLIIVFNKKDKTVMPIAGGDNLYDKGSGSPNFRYIIAVGQYVYVSSKKNKHANDSDNHYVINKVSLKTGKTSSFKVDNLNDYDELGELQYFTRFGIKYIYDLRNDMAYPYRFAPKDIVARRRPWISRSWRNDDYFGIDHAPPRPYYINAHD